MFENIANFFKKLMKSDKKQPKSKDSAKERLHLVLMQDRANVSADFLDLMKQEIIEVIKKYIDIDENAIDVRLTNKTNEDGTNGAPALYANIPIVSIKEDAKKKVEPDKKEEEMNNNDKKEENKQEESKKQEEPKKQENTVENQQTEEVKEESKEEEIKKEEQKEETKAEEEKKEETKEEKEEQTQEQNEQKPEEKKEEV